MSDRDGGLVFDDENISVGEFLGKWLSDCARGSVRLASYPLLLLIIPVHAAIARGTISQPTSTSIPAISFPQK